MERKQFTFYRSYYEAVAELPRDTVGEILLAVAAYALDGVMPGELSPIARAAFVLIRPTLDSGRAKAEAGRLGGESPRSVSAARDAGKNAQGTPPDARYRAGGAQEASGDGFGACGDGSGGASKARGGSRDLGARSSAQDVAGEGCVCGVGGAREVAGDAAGVSGDASKARGGNNGAGQRESGGKAKAKQPPREGEKEIEIEKDTEKDTDRDTHTSVRPEAAGDGGVMCAPGERNASEVPDGSARMSGVSGGSGGAGAACVSGAVDMPERGAGALSAASAAGRGVPERVSEGGAGERGDARSVSGGGSRGTGARSSAQNVTGGAVGACGASAASGGGDGASGGASVASCGGDGGFDRFWSEYPRRIGKAAARRAFQCAGADTEVLLEAVRRQKRSRQWLRDGGRYIPAPANWLAQRRWEDEPELPSAGQSPGGGHGAPEWLAGEVLEFQRIHSRIADGGKAPRGGEKCP